MSEITIGVLAIQGAFIEHIQKLKRLGVGTREVRKPEHMVGLDGLIIPGGESTTIGAVAKEWALLEPLKDFVIQQHKPVWGTCAGMIFLSNKVTSQKEGGQSLIGGLDTEVDRNHFGRQLQSFESPLILSKEILDPDLEKGAATPAVFIRAPCVTKVGKDVKILATLPEESKVVAVREKDILATAFHPELTPDLRWHKYFVNMVTNYKNKSKLM